MERNEVIAYLKKNKPSFFKKYHLTKIGIFGSLAKNTHCESSDIDLLVEFEKDTQNLHELKRYLRQEIQDVFHVHVDICREKYIKPIFKNNILSDAIYL